MFSPRKAQSFVKSEIVKTGAGDREEGGLVKGMRRHPLVKK
jgi:hypothetical protein